MNILTTKNLCFKNSIIYKDMNISSKKITFITGASGTGKSTLLKLLSYNTLADKGNILLNDKNITDYIPFTYRRIVMLGLQDAFLFSGTIEENFYQYYDYKGETRPSKKEIEYLLSACVLSLPLSKTVSEMSGGERQRLYISIVMSFRPKFLLLDEPTSALDTNNSLRLVENIISFTKDNYMGLVLVSHDCSLVDLYTEKTIDLGGDGLV